MDEPETLVLGPGAFRGYSEIGALIYFQKIGILGKVNEIIGVSAGAIIGSLLAFGFSPTAIFSWALGLNLFPTLEKALNIGHIFANFGKIDGLMSNSGIRLLLGEMFDRTLGKNATFAELPKKLIVVAHNITKGKPTYFSAKKWPKMRVLDAVMLSMNIPVIFERAEYQGNLYVDGALGDPYPVNKATNQKILSIYPISANTEYENIVEYIWDVLGAPIEQIRQLKMKLSPQCIHFELVSEKHTIAAAFGWQKRVIMCNEGFTAAENFLGTANVSDEQEAPPV